MITYRFIKYLLLHIKYTKILKRVFKDENLLDNLSKLFNSEFRMDWVGRIYTVINPLIQNGSYDINTQIFEYNENGFDNSAQIESYIMKQLNVAKLFIKTNNLFDMLTYRIEKIDDNGNYLFIIEPITWEDCKEYIRKFSYLLMGLLIITAISIYFFI